MRPDFERTPARARPVHPYAWLWEPLENDPGFLLRPMFSGKAAYIDGRMVLYFPAKDEPWRGVLACTGHTHHASLQAQYPELAPHPVLPKWLYLPETADTFERAAQQLVSLARQRDPRLGVEPKPRNRRSAARPRMP